MKHTYIRIKTLCNLKTRNLKCKKEEKNIDEIK